jgi:type IV pilus assembly protein PilP
LKLEPVLLLGVCLVLSGCEDDVVTGAPRARASASAQPSASASAAQSAIPKLDLQDADFAESDKSRDPFRSFARLFIEESAGQVESQVEVMLEKYSLEQLKLIGIITRVHPERAMLVDPNGVGHVVKRGQFVGKADVVQTAKNVGASYQLHWRVDRIRPNDVVFIREDPQNPDVPVARRVLPLRTEEEVAAAEALANSG